MAGRGRTLLGARRAAGPPPGETARGRAGAAGPGQYRAGAVPYRCAAVRGSRLPDPSPLQVSRHPPFPAGAASAAVSDPGGHRPQRALGAAGPGVSAPTRRPRPRPPRGHRPGCAAPGPGADPRPGRRLRPRYSAGQMYKLAANVGEYRLFVPWCSRSAVLSRRGQVLRAELEVGFPPFLERYVSEVFLGSRRIRLREAGTWGDAGRWGHPSLPDTRGGAGPRTLREQSGLPSGAGWCRPGPSAVSLPQAVSRDCRLFRHLETLWRFGPGLPGRTDTCLLDFSVSFEFRSALHARLASLFLDEVARRTVSAFEGRAQALFGPQAAVRPCPHQRAACRA
ncbi:hypothetical protein QYF61_020166 [Mycteria americana]|uniref:Coenzyme Q-binding protein COQ10 START domain-containing protein n=1 Tax=Mycteria americana TaxID=33587 RepID=A0AAN7MLZ3_MYCAM|nr:hypothetical protein QYF61_020166 [Mycteria americana]